jgi:hypothetical protein
VTGVIPQHSIHTFDLLSSGSGSSSSSVSSKHSYPGGDYLESFLEKNCRLRLVVGKNRNTATGTRAIFNSFIKRIPNFYLRLNLLRRHVAAHWSTNLVGGGHCFGLPSAKPHLRKHYNGGHCCCKSMIKSMMNVLMSHTLRECCS